MNSNIYDIISCILLIFIDLFALVPMLFILIFKKFQFVHKYVTSDIPGNPHAFDDSIISMMRTLPEPSNTNVVYTGLPLNNGPLLLTGTIPGGRCNSFNIYGSGTSDTPSSIDASTVTLIDNEFHIIITNENDINTINMVKNDKKYSILFANKSWKMGFFAMRNYLVHPGTLILSPTVRYLKWNENENENENEKQTQALQYNDNKQYIIRTSQKIVTGPCGLVTKYAPNIMTIQRFLAVNMLFILLPVLQLVISSTSNISGADTSGIGTGTSGIGINMMNQLYIALISMMLSVTIRSYLYIIGKKGLDRLITQDTCGSKLNQFQYTSLESGSKTSQPSVLHRYWVMPFRLDANQDLVITSKINPLNQKYWSIVVYDEYGLCLPQYIYDSNYISNTSNNTGNTGNSTCSTSTTAYDVSVTMSGNPNKSNTHNTSNMVIDLKSIMNRAKQCNGYVLFRLVHPTLSTNKHDSDSNSGTVNSVGSVGSVNMNSVNEIIKYSTPMATVVNTNGTGGSSSTSSDGSGMDSNMKKNN